ncbi:hypothetical protein [Desulfobacula phenolica]|uniref:Uncharacterized conserved protein, DUF342 family n=1 Tax=Desulfobacula phenolica TaxID=90732 RepID=A0A1H2DQ54_9BACT|nr:hypothetical protein [Desulfobacula phenolica]SDT84914.1 Uncharacterized conserved protein, DUF342 family [Desulfobacula phenolica]
MNASIPQIKSREDQNILSMFRSNLKILEIILTKKLISKGQYKSIRKILEDAVKLGQQSTIDKILESHNFISPQIIIKEQFKYNQIIIKLAQQLLKNTLIQKKNIEQEDENSFQKKLSEQKVIFSNLLTQITDDFLRKRVKNIDIILLETGLLEASQLDFLHNGLKHLEIKAMDRKFGEIAVKNKFVTKDIIDKALVDQTRLYQKTHKNHIIGDILVHKKEMTPETRDEILLLQNRILEEDWEETLRSICQSAIEEQEKNAVFGVLVVKENLMNKEKIKEALKLQNLEREAYKKRHSGTPNSKNQNPEQINTPRWIGDILVEDFGLSEKDRRKIVKKQMKKKIEIINLKLGGNIKDAQREMINQLDSYFQLIYSKNRIQAQLQVNKEIPSSMTTNNITLWLYNKKITYGIITNAIHKLLENKIKPGEKITVARGTEPIPEKFIPKINFTSPDALDNTQTFPPIVSKHSNLLTLIRIPGESGFNVNRNFVIAPKGATDITKGSNVIKKKDSFLATCDGVPTISDKGVISVSPIIVIPADLSCDNPAINHDCDVDVHGIVEKNVKIKCRKLIADIFKGHVVTSGDVIIKKQAVNAEIISKGSVTIPSVLNSTVNSEKNILIENSKSTDSTPYNKVSSSIISCNNFCIITNSKLFSSIIRARNKIILRKTVFESDCKLIVGDSVEVIACKTKIEKINAKIQELNSDIKVSQEEIRVLFDNLEKKDTSDIENEIESISKRSQKSKDDMDKILELKKNKRRLEQESKKKYDEYGDLFINMSNSISSLKKMKISSEKEKAELGKTILSLYKEDKNIPVIDAQKATLPKGLIVQFRHTNWALDADYTGFVLREDFNKKKQQYEIKKQRW